MKYLQFSSVQFLSHVWLFATPWTAALQASLSITNSWSLPNSCALSWWYHPTISSSVIPFFSGHQSFPGSGSFPMNRFFASGGQSTGASTSASVLSKKYSGLISQDWLVWSPCSPRDSQESSPKPQFESIHSSVWGLLYGPTLTSVHDYFKNHSFDYMGLCQQSDVSAFWYAV